MTTLEERVRLALTEFVGTFTKKIIQKKIFYAYFETRRNFSSRRHNCGPLYAPIPICRDDRNTYVRMSVEPVLNCSRSFVFFCLNLW
jgi:hypothetical protein